MKRKGMSASNRKRRKSRSLERRLGCARVGSLGEFAASLLAASGADSVELVEVDGLGRECERVEMGRRVA